ncbi:MAG: IS66 family insertion sequence element accessory protein TnpA [Bacteroidia bacterium]
MAVTLKWHQYIEAWQSSGMTQADYCRQHQLNVHVRTLSLKLNRAEQC